jgi:ATP-dependent Clp protease ATP-binding subunit ClpB
VKISDSALVAAATLSTRYISDRFLPDKAIDLVDEAAAKLKMESPPSPKSWTRWIARFYSSKWSGCPSKKKATLASGAPGTVGKNWRT